MRLALPSTRNTQSIERRILRAARQLIANAHNIDGWLGQAEGDIAIARELAAQGDKRKAKAISQMLAGVIANLENVRLHLGRAARIKHCPTHDDYEDSCHDCYLLQYGKLPKGERQ